MKRICLFVCFVFVCFVAITHADAQAVSGTIVDNQGGQWAYAVVSFTLLNPSGQRPVNTQTGGPVIIPPPLTANSSGFFTTSLAGNNIIVPFGTQWVPHICPFNPGLQCQTLQPFTLTLPIDISSLITAQLNPVPIGDPFLFPLSHNGITGRSNLNGSAYYDVTTSGLYVRNPASSGYSQVGSFVNGSPVCTLATGCGSVPGPTYPAAGIGVSTGTAWGTSIAPATLATWPAVGIPVSTGTAWGTSIAAANVPLLNAAINTFTGSVVAGGSYTNFNPSLAAGSTLYSFLTGISNTTDSAFLWGFHNTGTAGSNYGVLQVAGGAEIDVGFGGTLTANGSLFCQQNGNGCPAALAALPILSASAATRRAKACHKGSTWIDGDYLVICIAKNAPKRVKLEAMQ